VSDGWEMAARHNGTGNNDAPTNLITDQDVDQACIAATPDLANQRPVAAFRSALEAVAAGLRARWVAEALEEAANHPTATFWDDMIKRGQSAVSVTDLRVLAAEYRKGAR
jgi:hypothetical protein